MNTNTPTAKGTTVERVAIQAIVDQGVSLREIKSARRHYPKFTSESTATIDVTVETNRGAAYTVPVTVTVSYSDPVAI